MQFGRTRGFSKLAAVATPKKPPFETQGTGGLSKTNDQTPELSQDISVTHLIAFFSNIKITRLHNTNVAQNGFKRVLKCP